MKKITFNNKEYHCPQSWDEVTIKMVVQSGVLDEIIPDAPIVSIASAYTGISTRELTTAKQQEVEEILKTLEFVYEPYVPSPRFEFDFKGETFSTENDIINITFGDYVSIQTVLYNYREEPIKGLPRMLAVLCKKEGETLDTINVTERAKFFEDLPITIAKDIESFFLSNLAAYKRISQLSSMENDMVRSIQQQLKELKLIMKQRKADNGGSLRTKLLIGYYQIYLWYLTKLLERYFNSTHSEVSKENWMQILKRLFTKRLRRNKRSVV